MTKWTIGRRIAAGYAVLILLLMALVVVGTLALRSSREDFTSALARSRTARSRAPTRCRAWTRPWSRS